MVETPLLSKLKNMIEISGPISIAEYFHVCMADPKNGYYNNRQSIGANADFITAPEVSQMFGELIGIWCIDQWEKLDRPNQFSLVEIGPGKGTLMKDLLRTAKINQAFLQNGVITLIETSALLKASQKAALSDIEANINWIESIEDLPKQPTLLIANEFFDVLPIRQFIKSKTNWQERGVSLDEKGDLTDVLLPATIETNLLPKDHTAQADNTVFEISPSREAIAQQLAEHLSACSGAGLFIDYGHTKSGFGDTFQAMKNHLSSHVFDQPGNVDLTSHVDFERLAAVIGQNSNLEVTLSTQADFLLAIGLIERAQMLGANANEQTRKTISQAVDRLAGDDQMGNLFKVMRVFSNNLDN